MLLSAVLLAFCSTELFFSTNYRLCRIRQRSHYGSVALRDVQITMSVILIICCRQIFSIHTALFTSHAGLLLPIPCYRQVYHGLCQFFIHVLDYLTFYKPLWFVDTDSENGNQWWKLFAGYSEAKGNGITVTG